MKINCIIVDDEPENLKYLQQIIEDIDDVEIVKSFTDGSSFLESIPNIKFDMCILDNRLPDINGVDCAKKLRGKKIIFVSAHDIAAHDAFEVNAIDVLKKPVSKSRLEAAVKKCRNLIINEKGYVFIKTNTHGKMRFKLDDIIYITSDENNQYKKIITKEGEQIKTLKTSLEELIIKLPNDKFCIINKREILNTYYFKSFIGKYCVKINISSFDNKKSNNELKVRDKNRPDDLAIGEKYLPDLLKIIGEDEV